MLVVVLWIAFVLLSVFVMHAARAARTMIKVWYCGGIVTKSFKFELDQGIPTASELV